MKKRNNDSRELALHIAMLIENGKFSYVVKEIDRIKNLSLRRGKELGKREVPLTTCELCGEIVKDYNSQN